MYNIGVIQFKKEFEMDTFDGKYPSKGFMKALLLFFGLGTTFAIGIGFGASGILTVNHPALGELKNCALWNAEQIGIKPYEGLIPLGFDVQRTGETINVSCTRREEATRESFWGHP